MKIDFSIIGKRIQTTRKNKKISQEQLASMIGISESHISQIERGIKSPSVEILIGIAVALKVSVDELLNDLCYRRKDDIVFYELLQSCSSEEKAFFKELITYIKPRLKHFG